MALDLSDKAIAEALQEIKNPSSSNTWVLLGHVGVTPKIRVEEKGETFAELIDELNAGKIFYAYCRFSINDMAKFLFLTWCGDSIADQIFKGKFHTFNKDMERFLKGQFHLQVNARSEDDLDEEEIKKKLKLATGAFYTQQNLGQKAVSLGEAKQNISTSSSAQKVEKSYAGINKEASNKFWEQQQKEKAEAEKREQAEKEKKERETKAQQQKLKEQQEQLARQREAEEKEKETKAATTKPVVSASSSGIRAKFEQLAVSQPAAPVSSSSRPAPKPLQSKFGQTPAPAKEEPKPAPSKPIGKITPPAAVSKPAPAPTPAPPVPVPTPAPVAKLPPPPVKQPEPEPEEDEFEPPRQEPEEQELPAPAEEALAVEPEPVVEAPVEPEPEPEPEPVQEQLPEPVQEAASSGDGQLAVGLYDFNTEDSEELPFAEGDTLVILKTEGDWWLAEKDGRKGFIPANYVELK